MAERGELTDLAAAAPRRGRDRGRRGPQQQDLVCARRQTAGGGRRSPTASGTLQLVFFGRRHMWLEKKLAPGVARSVRRPGAAVQTHRASSSHPEFLLLDEATMPTSGRGRRLCRRADPGLPGHQGHARPGRSRNAASSRCWSMLDPVPDPLPATMRAEHRLLDLRQRRCGPSTGRSAAGLARGSPSAQMGRGAGRAARCWRSGARPRRRTPRRRGRPRPTGSSTAFDAPAPVRPHRRSARGG